MDLVGVDQATTETGAQLFNLLKNYISKWELSPYLADGTQIQYPLRYRDTVISSSLKCIKLNVINA